MSELRITLREWESIGPENVACLAGYHFQDTADRVRATDLNKAGTLKLDELYSGLRIQARAHVGRIRLGTLTVTVVPKIAPSELLALFRYAYGLRDITRFSDVTYSMDGNMFQNLLIAQLYGEARELLERGIARTYIARREALANPRGSIDFARLAARPDHATVALPCRYHLRSTDHLLNRTLLAGLTLAQAMAIDPELRLAVGRQCRLFRELAGIEELSAALLLRAKRKLNRLVTPYRSLVELIEMLYLGTFVEIDGERSQRPLPGFLFDMNRFFQRLVERFLVENLRTARVEREFGLVGLMRYAPRHNPRRATAPRPRPDYAIKQRGRVVRLLDAKYRDLWDMALPRDMLYQLTVYALSQGRGGSATILYPAIDPSAVAAQIEIRDPETGSSAGHVWLRPVHLGRLVQLVENDRPAVCAERERWALELAGLA